MTRVYYQAAVGAMVVCDITRPETMELAVKWKQDLDSKVFLGSTGKTIPCVLLVNKCDLGQLHKTKEDMDAFCRDQNFAGWFETSAKDDKNVNVAFNALVEHVLAATSDVPVDDGKTAGAVKPGAGRAKRKEEGGCPC